MNTYRALSVLGFERVFAIGDVGAAADPGVGVGVSVFQSGVDKGLHTLRVGAVVLLKVHHIEAVGMASLEVANSEVIPLSVVKRVEIEA